MNLKFKDGKLITKDKTLVQVLTSNLEDNDTSCTGILYTKLGILYVGMNAIYKLKNGVIPVSEIKNNNYCFDRIPFSGATNDYFVDIAKEFNGTFIKVPIIKDDDGEIEIDEGEVILNTVYKNGIGSKNKISDIKEVIELNKIYYRPGFVPGRRYPIKERWKHGKQ